MNPPAEQLSRDYLNRLSVAVVSSDTPSGSRCLTEHEPGLKLSAGA
jgi:hypothetical protein